MDSDMEVMYVEKTMILPFRAFLPTTFHVVIATKIKGVSKIRPYYNVLFPISTKLDLDHVLDCANISVI